MIHTDFNKNIMLRGTEIAIWDQNTGKAYTFSFEEKPCGEADMVPVSLVKREDEFILKAMAEVLQKMGYIPDGATQAELKATKHHLDDMRKIAFDKLTK